MTAGFHTPRLVVIPIHVVIAPSIASECDLGDNVGNGSLDQQMVDQGTTFAYANAAVVRIPFRCLVI